MFGACVSSVCKSMRALPSNFHLKIIQYFFQVFVKLFLPCSCYAQKLKRYCLFTRRIIFKKFYDNKGKYFTE